VIFVRAFVDLGVLGVLGGGGGGGVGGGLRQLRLKGGRDYILRTTCKE